MIDVRLLDAMFIPGQFIGPFTNAHPGLGGVCTFVGEVRGGGGIEALELSHYEPLTLPGMQSLAEGAVLRFQGVPILARCAGLIGHRALFGGGLAPQPEENPAACQSRGVSHSGRKSTGVPLASKLTVNSTSTG